ncbi:MAG: hypothetical protein SFW66_06190 [Gammaproteobacteria bacterium]|nr:hypothetical protein [Gammaproteobacteria bacterium]
MTVFILLSWVLSATAYGDTTPVIQIDSYFRNPSIANNPSWLLILRDEETGTVTPQLFEFTKPSAAWVVFAPGHMYRVTASELSFNAHTKINNFCQLQDGILAGQSMWIRLSGTFSPQTIICHISKYRQ